MNYADCNVEDIFCAVGPAIAVMVVLFILATSLIVLVVKAVISCRIFSRAGYHWALGLLMLVPIACFIMPFVLAFGKWPVLEEVTQLRRQLKEKTTQTKT